MRMLVRRLPALGVLALGLGGLIIALPAAARARGPTVYGALQSLQHSGALTAEADGEDASTYTEALRAVKRLSGTRRVELGSVLANVQQIAAAGELTPSRAAALFLTLERNVQWWTTEPLLSAGQRMSFPESRLVWEYYPGQGIEIQWLATFGEANGYYLEGHENTQLREVLDEAIPLATQRAGGIAWEYLFHFDGGSPPWTSGLSQGTALQALSRAYSRLKEPAYLTAAKQALGIFQTPPPRGRARRHPRRRALPGVHLRPQERILNGFIQAVTGLYDYAKLTGDPLGRQLFEAGDAEARVEVPHYDTGGWSLYDQHSESNLNYHELLAEFLQNLCQRTQKADPARAPPRQPDATATTHVPPSTAGTGGRRRPRRQRRERTRARAASGRRPRPDPRRSDLLHDRATLHADLRTPPAIALLTHTLRGGARGGVQLSLSKIATVSLDDPPGRRVVWTNSALVEGGKPRLLWVTPRKGGTYTVSIARWTSRATARPRAARSP